MNIGAGKVIKRYAARVAATASPKPTDFESYEEAIDRFGSQPSNSRVIDKVAVRPR